MMTPRRLVGLTFIVFVLAIQVPFVRLARVFRYPDILRQPPEEILSAFQQGGGALIGTWYLFAIVIVLFLAAALALPHVQREAPLIPLRVATGFAALSALVQMAGLLRWVFVVPGLAKQFAEARSAEAKSMVMMVFSVQHQAFGVMLGEHLGQLLLALWTIGVAVGLDSLPRAIRVLGIASGALMLAGLSDGFSTVLPLESALLKPMPMIAFTVWSIWLLALGASLLRQVGALPAENVAA
jgi:uncharacterized protein DUF4386